jgi:hypothetical protein
VRCHEKRELALRKSVLIPQVAGKSRFDHEHRFSASLDAQDFVIANRTVQLHGNKMKGHGKHEKQFYDNTNRELNFAGHFYWIFIIA